MPGWFSNNVLAECYGNLHGEKNWQWSKATSGSTDKFQLSMSIKLR